MNDPLHIFLLQPFWTKNPPAPVNTLAEMQQYFERRVPQEYLELLAVSDGAKFIHGELFSAVEMMQVAPCTGMSSQLPHFIPFGSDRGRETFYFDTRKELVEIVMIHITGTLEDSIFIAHNLGVFLLRTAKLANDLEYSLDRPDPEFV